MSNFQFLHKEWPEIFEIAKEAEDMAIKRHVSYVQRKSCLEKGIRWMYENDQRLFENTDNRKLGQFTTDKSLKNVTR